MADDLAKMILDTLKDYDYKRLTQKKIDKLAKGSVYGLMCEATHEIWIAKGLSYETTTLTQLHEFAHAYLHTINKFDVPEEEVDRLAYEWKQKLDGVYDGHK